MRALLGMVLFSLVGCDTLWAGYIGMGDFRSDAGMTCTDPAGCDMATEVPDAALPDLAENPPDLQPGDCLAEKDCFAPAQYCDLNMNRCVTDKPDTSIAFIATPSQNTMMTPRYMLMATGDYNGDDVNDVAVSGVFNTTMAPGFANSVSATANTPVDIYLSDGAGTLTKDSNCSLPGEAPVHLLTVPGTGKVKDLFVATLSGAVYRCTRGAAPTKLVIGGTVPPGFSQLSLASHEGPSTDLVIRTSVSLFTDSVSGYAAAHRPSGANFNGLEVRFSDSNVISALPYKFKNDMFDTIATTWAGTTMHPGIEFHYVRSNNSYSSPTSAMTATANVSDMGGYVELINTPFSAITNFKVLNQAGSSILYTYSQKRNSFTVLYGDTPGTFAKQAQQRDMTQLGLMLPYAGDANDDGQDEIGLYTLQLNNTQINRHLMLLAYKGAGASGGAGTIGSTIYDINLPAENFRGMALEYLGKGLSDKPKAAKRKHLIALVENPGGGSRLLVLRPDLNYIYPAP